MRRRHLLALCGAGLAGLAGCASDQPTADTATTPDRASPAGSLAASVLALQPAVVTLATPDSLGVSGEPDTQYLFLSVSVTAEDPPARPALTVRFDGDKYGPLETEEPREFWRRYHDERSRYDADSGEGWVCFPLPATGAPEGAGLTWSGNVWSPPPDVRARLAAESPPLSVSWSVPDSVEAGSAPAVEVSVTNEGERAGRFVGALNRSGPRVAYAPAASESRLVPAGGTETWAPETDVLGDAGEWSETDGPTEAAYHLHWPGDRAQQRTTVLPAD